MVFFSYLDDSKDRGAKRICVSGGLYGSREDWEGFRINWKKILDMHGLEYYKSSECFSVTGQFEKYREGAPRATPEARRRARAIRSEFLGCAGKHLKLRGVGVAIHTIPYRKFEEMTRNDNVLPADPYKVALSSIMFEIVRCIREEAGHNMVAFIHDGGNEFPGLYECYLQFKELNPKNARFVGGFQSLDDKKTPALQVADLLANHTTFLAGKAMDNQDASIEMRANIRILGVWNELYLRKYLRDWYRRHKRTPPAEL